jgi:predicted GNAT family N-acyltransferase
LERVFEMTLVQPSFRLIAPGSKEYILELALRDEILRRPLGLSLADDDLKGEPEYFHFGAFLGDKLIGTLIMTPVDRHAVKMRQVAVAEAFQGVGVGRALVAFAESFIRGKSFSRVELHARKTAVPFYVKLGYQQAGPEFIEITVPHQGMIKQLA